MDNASITTGLSDHDIVLTQVNVRPEVIKEVLRNIHLYKKADWDQLKQFMRNVFNDIFHIIILNSHSLTVLPLQHVG